MEGTEVGAGKEDVELMCLEKLTHIYVASDDALIAANVLSALEMQQLAPCIIGQGAWLRREVPTLDQLQRLQVWLGAPAHVDYAKASLHTFRTAFYAQFAAYPSYHACLGYEMMLFLGRMLARHGVYFQKHWGEGCYSGAIFDGFVYGTRQDNQCVPIVQLPNAAIAD